MLVPSNRIQPGKGILRLVFVGSTGRHAKFIPRPTNPTTCMQELLEVIKRDKKFTFEEYQAMLNLQCGVDQTLGQTGVSQAADRNYSMYVIELHGLELEYSNGEPGS